MATYVADASAGADRAGGLFLLLPCFFLAGGACCCSAGAGAAGAFRSDPGADRLPDGVPGVGKGARRGFCAFCAGCKKIILTQLFLYACSRAWGFLAAFCAFLFC